MQPRVVLTDLSLFGLALRPSSSGPLRERITTTRELTLSHDQNSLAIDMAVLDFVRPDENQFTYVLEGFDQKWKAPSRIHMATYTNLPPGSYTFRAKGANSNGTWSETEATLRIRIRPPWWRTTWAYALYAVTLLFGLVVVDRMQRQRLIRREREKARERELEQAREIELAYGELKRTQAQLIQQEKLASLGALTAGIAHEIKNPLNFVNNFAGLAAELADEVDEALAAHPEARSDIEEVIADLKLNTRKIGEHGRRADGIVRSMLEHSRGTKGEREPTDVNALLEEYVNLAYHGMRAQKADFDVTIERDYDEAVEPVELVPQEMGRVCLNLLNNAFQA
ncbi:MAG: triple tyrosine motif-containing protein, partial [Rhodothermales bacterium]